ncbi:MAG TPA: ROK family transcriptional regulator [Desulfofustis sp.]|jgi:predicted NBD/HSP70 family sugar kinase|nr:ROK family transcriptional regulator [Desulfofustis sp. PB-SRB1]HBH29513.1 ROK family transcriptional regulator [Desulfofustis sp.]
MFVANRDLMRAINRFAILHTIRDAESISRIDISHATGLSRSTVTGITAELLREGMVREHDRAKSEGGRRPVPLSLNPDGAYTVGVHLSVNRITVVLMNLQAAIINSYSELLDPGNLAVEPVVEKLVQAVRSCLWDSNYSRTKISGIGIALPGLIESRRGYIYYIPNYGWKDVNLAERLTQRLKTPVYVENSANTLVVFEQWFGFGRGVDNFVLVTTEHGIGMGMVFDGKIYRGNRGIAGELGHMVIDSDGPLCRCGERGCLEAICGNNAILRDSEAELRNGTWARIQEGPLRIEEVLEVARRGNEALRAIYRRVGEKLGIALNSLHTLLDPENIIISGKGVLAGELLFPYMMRTLHQGISFDEPSPTRLLIQQWEPTNYARGAGALVLQEIYNSPANRIVPML